ncbi:Alpha-L-fucosidase [Catenulispora acidiphila DSM 44928]|uniref:alpha-L-fucosidase n=1 Tax=Catenulispora acidiphila (strain DSM 44928 / JCM 14897 / NBRC 102108 / NRRL B-24433 / ID139908) TaxID=479433 RepID=C7Q371_CATAD|nr:alpha-L-fucosidase [Catenulispora acidiphila]ACU73807.1 Alpha-L-fucosidase [Catenulispora acidiphila DSM 44928]
MTNPVSRRAVLSGTAAAIAATSLTAGGESPAAAVQTAAAQANPLVPLRIPKLDQGMWQQPDATIQWLRDTRLGMFIHWGVYAGPAHGEWYMHSAAITPAAYQNFVTQSSPQQFTADAYKPSDWAALAKQLGAGYTVLTARHHDGFALWPSTYPAGWNAGQAPLKRDFVKDYVAAVRAAGLRVGLYYSPINWRYPGYYDVTGTNCAPNPWGYTTDPAHHENARLMKEEVYQCVKELVTQYGALDDIWWDGGWLAEQGSDADASFFWEPGRYRDSGNGWQVDAAYGATETGTGLPLGLAGLVRQSQPTALASPRSGWVGDYDVDEGGSVPAGRLRSGHLVQKTFSVGSTWGYNSDGAVMSHASAMALLVNSFIRDMCVLINVGPDRHGTVPANQAALMQQLGTFMKANGEAVYNTRGGPWDPVDGQYGFTFSGQTVYVHLLPGYSGSSFTTPALGDARAVRAYDVVSHAPLTLGTGSGNQATISGIDRTRYPDDTVVALVLDRTVVPADIALGRTAGADSVETAHGNLASHAVDGDTSTRWCASDGAAGHWLTVDLGGVHTVTGARVAWEFGGHRYGYRIDGSTDGTSWTTLSDQSATGSTSQVQTVAFTAATRHLRITVTALDAGCWASIRSFEVYDRAFYDPSL